jgi:hypothetical protein
MIFQVKTKKIRAFALKSLCGLWSQPLEASEKRKIQMLALWMVLYRSEILC